MRTSTGDLRADAALLAAIDGVEDAFPGTLTAPYITGSRADGTYLEDSDLDLFLVIADPHFTEPVRSRVESAPIGDWRRPCAQETLPIEFGNVILIPGVEQLAEIERQGS